MCRPQKENLCVSLNDPFYFSALLNFDIIISTYQVFCKTLIFFLFFLIKMDKENNLIISNIYQKFRIRSSWRTRKDLKVLHFVFILLILLKERGGIVDCFLSNRFYLRGKIVKILNLKFFVTSVFCYPYRTWFNSIEARYFRQKLFTDFPHFLIFQFEAPQKFDLLV